MALLEPSTSTSEPVIAGDFERDTRLVADPHRAGVLHGHIPDAWKVIKVFGGVSMAVGLRGVEVALARPDLTLLSANAVFTAPLDPGAVEVETRVLRSGRSAAQGVAYVRQQGADEVALCVTATWGQRHDSPIDFVDLAYPDGAGHPDDHDPPPEREPDDPFPKVNFHEQMEWRPAIGNRFWDPPEAWVDGPARFGSWSRFLVEPRLPDGTIDPVSHCVPADQLGGAIGQRLGPRTDGDDLHFFTVTLEMGLQVLRPTTSAWLLQHTRAHHTGDGYGFGTVELWDTDGHLVAMADQRARLRIFQPGDGFFTG